MKALVLENYSKPPEIKDIPIPKPAPGEVLVKVAYCGVNRVDLAVLAGRFRKGINFPLVMGCEITGTLPNGRKVAVNPYYHCGKCRFCRKKDYLVCELGRPLIGVQKNGGYAEYMTVPMDNTVFMPLNFSLKNTCAVTLSGGTAYRMTEKIGKIKSGDYVAVTAGGSGVGVYSCQLAKVSGGKVIALAGTDEKLKRLRYFDLSGYINYSKNNWEKEVLGLTNNKGLTVILDTVGGKVLETLMPFLDSLGKIILCGATESPDISVNLIDLYIKQQSISGSSGFMNEDLRDIFNLLKKGKIKPVIDSIYSLSEIKKAWEKLRKREVFGKILIKIND